jgi:hypothetical protein
LRGQAESAFLRVARRFGAVSDEDPPADSADASAVGSAAVAFFRVAVRRFGAAVAASEAGAVSELAFVRVEARRFGAVAAPAGAAETSPTSASDAGAASTVGIAADRPAGWRRVVDRRFGASDDTGSPAEAASVDGATADADRVDADRGGAAFGDWASCARSISWSSSGTSLHGSLERAGRSDRSGRSWRSKRSGRSPRPNAGSGGRPPPLGRPPGADVLPLTSG